MSLIFRPLMPDNVNTVHERCDRDSLALQEGLDLAHADYGPKHHPDRDGIADIVYRLTLDAWEARK